jgi:hypothetical protein
MLVIPFLLGLTRTLGSPVGEEGHRRRTRTLGSPVGEEGHRRSRRSRVYMSSTYQQAPFSGVVAGEQASLLRLIFH